jgi:hypothetical protein
MVFYQQAARLPVIDGAKCNSYPAFFLAFEHQVLGRINGAEPPRVRVWHVVMLFFVVAVPVLRTLDGIHKQTHVIMDALSRIAERRRS